MWTYKVTKHKKFLFWQSAEVAFFYIPFHEVNAVMSFEPREKKVFRATSFQKLYDKINTYYINLS